MADDRIGLLDNSGDDDLLVPEPPEDQQQDRIANSNEGPEGASTSRNGDTTPAVAPERVVEAVEAFETPTTKTSCLKACLNKHRREQKFLLILNILVLMWAALTAGLTMLELESAYGQCMIGLPLYAGGLDPRNVKSQWCKCPLYTIILTSSVPWLSIMVNWVSDLHSKKAAFYKWVKWQAGLTGGAGFGILLSAGMSVWGFGTWCQSIQAALYDEDEPNKQISKICYKAAEQFDTAHPTEFVKLQHTFYYTVGITIMILIHLGLWIASNYFTLLLLKVEPKDNLNHPYAHRRAPPGAGPVHISNATRLLADGTIVRPGDPMPVNNNQAQGNNRTAENNAHGTSTENNRNAENSQPVAT